MSDDLIEVLQELGIGAERIGALLAGGVVRASESSDVIGV